MQNRALALSVLWVLTGCGAPEPAAPLAPVREVIEIPVRSVRELRHHFSPQMSDAGYDAETLQADARMIEGYVPPSVVAGWQVERSATDPVRWGYQGHVGTVRYRLAHPKLGRAELSLSVDVAQRSCLDAHFLLLSDLNGMGRGTPLHDADGARIGDAGFERLRNWERRDADTAIAWAVFVRHNVTITLSWDTARVDRADDNDRLIVEVAQAIDAHIRKAKLVATLAGSTRAPTISEFAFETAGPIHAPDSDAGASPTYQFRAVAEPRRGGPVHLEVVAAGADRKLWTGPWGRVDPTDTPNTFTYTPDREPGTRELWAFAVNARGLVAEKMLPVNVLPPAPAGADDGADDDADDDATAKEDG